MVTVDIISEIPLFKGLPEEVLTSIAPLCRRESFPAGTGICSPGRPADRLYFLMEGRIGLLVHPTSLPAPMTIMILSSPGESFGWSALVGRGHYTAQAQATTAVDAISVDGQALLNCLDAHPVAGLAVMKRVAEIISGRLRTMRTLVLETVCD
jgi:CRP-like cAMP-binding protein